MNYPIPRNSAKAWLAYKNRSPQNPGLIFDRFVQDWGSLQGKDKEAKKKAWVEIAEVAQKADQGLLQQWNLRWQATVEAAGAKAFSMKTGWRLMAGLGGKGPLEAGFTFHRYGFPVLPGSSVKGIARAWGLYIVAESLAAATQLNPLDLDHALTMDNVEKYQKKFTENFPQANDEAINLAESFRSIFGTPGSSGKAVFFDAIPKKVPRLELDVMNPHYAEYYQDKTGKTPPAGWISPVPVYFLAVAKDSEFNYAVGWRSRHSSDSQELHLRAIEWLKSGLTNLGAGAKTSAGYGYFLHVEETKSDSILADDPDKLRAERMVAEVQSLKTTAVAGSINQYYQRWKSEEINPAQKRRVAEAIVAKVKEAEREKQSLEKEWYKELLLYLEENYA